MPAATNVTLSLDAPVEPIHAQSFAVAIPRWAEPFAP
jgi:hypothetical protein